MRKLSFTIYVGLGLLFWLGQVLFWTAWFQTSAQERIIYTRPDGGVSIVSPAPRCVQELMRPVGTPTGPGECPALGKNRAGAIDWIRQKDVPVDASDVSVIDQSLLPSRTETDAQGDLRPTRNAWRRQPDGSLLTDQTKIPPGWERVGPRLRLIIPDPKRDARWYRSLIDAVQNKDTIQIQTAYDALKALQAGVTPPLTQAEFDALKLTLTEKKIPFTP